MPDRVVSLGSNRESPRIAKWSNGSRRCYAELLPLDDTTLMEEVRAENGDAFAVLFDRYYNRVLDVALKILRDRGEAEDILQAIFLEIYQKAAQFDSGKGKFYTWLMQYAYHRSIRRKNYLIVRQFYGRNLPVEGLTPLDQGVLKLYENPTQECKRFVHQALAMLNEAQKRTIEMFHFEGLTFPEIAEITDESYASVRHHYYRGLAKLKGYLRSIRRDTGGEPSHVQDLGVKNAEA
ncbi:MAG TPA: sigma-70 family RNA polymerase sigma factor [Terracidiphilus sp.]|nr:sigma-70 family RNA polymerase sigma factor [Terracidiphilus sp.]